MCEKFSSMKNGADIRMALDIIESCWKAPEIKEYILFTTDSDFVPVLQRLTEKHKTSAVLVNEARMEAHTAFKIFADVLVPLRQLSEALTYKRAEKGRRLAQGAPASASQWCGDEGAVSCAELHALPQTRSASGPGRMTRA